MDRTKDLRKRGEKTVLVKKPGAQIDLNILSQHTKVEVMDPSIVKYSKIYTEDLSERLGLNDASLPNSVAFPALLNPMFGNEKLIVESGLMTEMQYNRAKSRLLQKMVRILDRKNPITHGSMGCRSDLDSEDEGVEYTMNENYAIAEKEWKLFETFKVKIHRPSVAPNTAKTLGTVRKILVGPLDGRGEDLPSGKNLADYLDKCGRMSLLRFYQDHRERYFPTLWIVEQYEEPTKLLEVGCKRFPIYQVVCHLKSALD